MVIKVNRIIIRNAGLKVREEDLVVLRKQVAALFKGKIEDILFNYEETGDTKVRKSDKNFNINSKSIF